MTTTFQRTMIWVITIALTVGTLGLYFLIIFQNNNSAGAAQDNNQSSGQQVAGAQTQQPVDASAFKVDGKVKNLQAFDLKVGDGAEVKPGDNVKVHYKGTIAQTGQKFDSSYDRGEPIDIGLAQVIPGWQQGVPGMKVGGKRRLIIPSALGYGAQGNQAIPPNSDLVFEIEVLAINPPAKK